MSVLFRIKIACFARTIGLVGMLVVVPERLERVIF
jgi:hypothetical protein